MDKVNTYTSTGIKLIHHPEAVSKAYREQMGSPISLQIGPTSFCNLKCEFCSNVNRKKHETLNLLELVDFIYDLKLLGLKTVELSVRGDELIPVNDDILRLKSIKNIVDGRKATKSYAIDAEKKFVEDHITDWVSHKQHEPLFKIVLDTGRHITVTKSHSVYFYENNQIVKKKVADAKIGDVVVLSSGKMNIEEVQILPYKNKAIPITEDMCRLLGYFVAEGSYTFQRDNVAHGICFTFDNYNEESHYIDDVVNIITSEFNCIPNVDYLENKTIIRVSRKHLNEIFLDVFGVERTQPFRKVPDIIFNVSYNKQIEFLKGLYAGDGNFRNTISKGYHRNVLAYKTSSIDLQRSLVFLLDLMGIRSTITDGTNVKRYIEGRELPETKYYVVSVNNRKDVSALSNVLSFMGATPVYKDSKYSNHSYNIKYIDISDDCYGLKIKRIEQLEDIDERVYDISVGQTHRFESSFRILCSNTGGGDPTMYDGLETLILQCWGMNLRVGMITNGIKLKEMDQSVLDKLTWLRISMNCLDYVNRIDVPQIKGTMGFSYVWNNKTTHEILEELYYCVKGSDPAYVRIVPNCQSSHIEQMENNRKLSKIVHELGSPYFYQVKEFRKSKECYWGYFKPFLLHDGFVYPCSSVVLNDTAGRYFNEKFRWCHMNDLKDEYAQKMKSFPTESCDKCVFTSQNEMVAGILNFKENEMNCFI